MVNLEEHIIQELETPQNIEKYIRVLSQIKESRRDDLGKGIEVIGFATLDDSVLTSYLDALSNLETISLINSFELDDQRACCMNNPCENLGFIYYKFPNLFGRVVELGNNARSNVEKTTLINVVGEFFKNKPDLNQIEGLLESYRFYSSLGVGDRFAKEFLERSYSYGDTDEKSFSSKYTKNMMLPDMRKMMIKLNHFKKIDVGFDFLSGCYEFSEDTLVYVRQFINEYMKLSEFEVLIDAAQSYINFPDESATRHMVQSLVDVEIRRYMPTICKLDKGGNESVLNQYLEIIAANCDKDLDRAVALSLYCNGRTDEFDGAVFNAGMKLRDQYFGEDSFGWLENVLKDE